ncbi:MAG: endopeptidase La [Proteobacteria bacterium]|nr:endopeptidase La [Pseudomonadota bacterium]
MDSQDSKRRRTTKTGSENIRKILDDDYSESESAELPVFPINDMIIFPNGFSVMKLNSEVQANAALRAMREKEHIVAVPVRPQYNIEELSGLNTLDAFYPVGVCTRVLKIVRKEENGLSFWQVTIRGIKRVQVKSVSYDSAYNILRMHTVDAEETRLSIIGEAVYEEQTLLRTVRQSAKGYFERCQATEEVREAIRLCGTIQDAGLLSDFLSAHIDMPYEQRAELLACLSIRDRLQLILDVLANQMEVAKLVATTAQKIRTDLDKQQRDYFIRQHIKALREQIAEEPESDSEEIKARIEKMDADPEVIDYTMKQWKRMVILPQASAEYSVARSHIETLLDIPWHEQTEDHLNIADARRILDEDHYGLKDVKERIIEHLAVLALRHDLKAPILCLYGPPGVGKTSIGKSIARALGRKFERISLGGIHDEAEIRGHRRTYVASMPGRIVQALRHAKTMNPVMMLDEIDKLTSNNHGDPASALLEVLDPEQHNAFVDNYIETPIDLSNVLFITTANSLDTIPGPLRDRMEIIEIQSYTHVDKRSIASDFLIPKLLKQHGLMKSNMSISAEALDRIISYYTREAGVRQLEQRLGAVCRKVAAKVVEDHDAGKKKTRVSITPKNLETYLGKTRYDYDMIEPDRLPGISTGLAWTSVGGDILFIETNRMSGKGELVITGKLGDVMQESVRAAMTVVKANAEKLGLDPAVFSKTDIHLHVPAGATPKDGPSAGCAIFTAILSLFKEIPVPATLAMTGEISLRGNVLPVGGIREKVLAAHRAGIKTILLPKRNMADLDEIPEAVRNELTFYPISKVSEVVKHVFDIDI